MQPIILTHLYAKEMAIYGDKGNLISLRDVLVYNGFTPAVIEVGIGEKLPPHSDFYFIGGGADKDQVEVMEDFLTKKHQLIQDLQNNVPLLAICGGYQLLGKSFVTGNKITLSGLNWFPITTESPDQKVSSRAVGNCVIHSLHPDIPGYLVGFENHGGQTKGVSDNFYPLGKVLKGIGNNNSEKLEGCYFGNTIGCYFHGPCLAKNPELLRYFCSKILKNRDMIMDIRIPVEYTNLHDSLLKRFL